MKEVRLSAYHFDAQAFLIAAHDMNRGEFAALDTLQYGLARDAERAHCLAHRQEVLTGITAEAILEVFGEANTPRCAGCRLLAGNNAVIESRPPAREAQAGTIRAQNRWWWNLSGNRNLQSPLLRERLQAHWSGRGRAPVAAKITLPIAGARARSLVRT